MNPRRPFRDLLLQGLIALIPFTAPPSAATTADSLFAEANEAYRTGDYEGAIAIYEVLLGHGWQSGELYYNLGTAHFKAENLGHSVANFERALRLLPRDSDVRANLEFARERTLDKEIVEAELPPFRLLRSTAARLTWTEWLILTEVAFAGFLCILALAIFRPTRREGLRDSLLVSGTLLMLLLTLFGISTHDHWLSHKGVVLESEIAVRSGPGNEFTREFILHEGTLLAIDRESGEWLLCSLEGDLRGWLPANTIEPL